MISIPCFVLLGGVIAVATNTEATDLSDSDPLKSLLDNSTKVAAACPCSNVNWCNTITAPPRKEVFAFSVGGRDWKSYDWSKVTTIAMFDKYDPELMCYAHSQGVRVVLKGAFSNTTLFDKKARHQWLMNQLSLAITQHMDGINIDVEFPLNNTAAPALTQLVEETVKVFHNSIPNSQVTFDVAWSPMYIEACCECIDGRCYEYKKITEASDFVFVMSYDEQSQICGDCIGIANSPYDQTAKGIQGFLDRGISPDKLVLGVPWYGYDYPCLKLENNVCSIKKVTFRGVPCSDAAGTQKEYQILQSILRNNVTSGRLWNDAYKAPFFNYKNATGYQHQMWYDDPQSLNYRLKYAKDKSLRGVGMWHADCLDYSNDTMVKEMWGTFDTFLK